MAAVKYEDPRLEALESEKKATETQLDGTFTGMAEDAEKFYREQIDAAAKWAETQQAQQQAETDLAVERLETEKSALERDYLKEQSGAYVDFQKQSNAYGVTAEKLASAGLRNTGYGESSAVGMYNAYQNRVAAARETYGSAVENYNLAIKEAQTQNSAALAEIAYKALETQLALSLEGFEYRNELLTELTDRRAALDSEYHDRYLDVLGQIDRENEFREQQRQFDLNLQLKQREYDAEQRRFLQEYDLKLKAFNEEIRQYDQNLRQKQRQFDEEMERLKTNDAVGNAIRLRELEQEKLKLQQAQKEYAIDVALKQQALLEEKRQFEENLAFEKSEAERKARTALLEAQAKAVEASKTEAEKVEEKLEREKLVREDKPVELENGYARTVARLNELRRKGESEAILMYEILMADRAGVISAAEAYELRKLYSNTI